eukprot:TRINITY_DN6393_c0_g3_i5.p1 TRINITY_DN6393_c0_g3~~TRINITY_DN6393_c0_g3_i5.p1  ORF type:complete len:359 (-),score=-11.16 TRINITY_DN6393_c0_g3_i5:236-1228(-)
MQSLGVIRYADDFVIIHKDKTVLEEAKEVTENWLNQTSKLQLNPSKTQIICTDNGFNFLGYRFINVVRNEKKRIKIYPEKSSIKNLVQKIGDITRKKRAVSSYDLIQILRPIIIGWGNYYCICECSETFHSVDNSIFQILRAWVFRRDRRNNRTHIREKYFPPNQTYKFRDSLHKDNWILVGQKKIGTKEKQNFLPKLQWIKSVTHRKILPYASIYDGNDAYWASRSLKYGDWSPTQRKLLKMQNGLCTWCNSNIIQNEVVEIDHITPKFKGGDDKYSNLQLLHKQCHKEKSKLDLNSKLQQLRLKHKPQINGHVQCLETCMGSFMLSFV